ncbi:MAG: restriction endonuclease [Chloroflexi bacterium]|nr:restriction endonuclease [Chloroflexota bacterium]
MTAENALRNFSLRLSYDAESQLGEVQPYIIQPSETFADPLDLDPIAYEHLIGELLRAMGFTTTVTKASGDGGIDVEALNPDPVFGGRVIVQCKRYGGTVGSPPVRDLYGAMTDARAMKGLLVTTSDFSPDARRFAEGKPIELINGTQLRALLRQYRLLAEPGDG